MEHDPELLVKTLSQTLLDLILSVKGQVHLKEPPWAEAFQLLVELGYLNPNGTRTKAGRELQEAE